MATLRELKSRIGSVSSTQKTTSAMKMISSAKMHKATGQLQRLQPYRKMVQGIIGHLLATDGEFSSPLIEEREVKNVAIVVFGSDDGLCGGFNVNIAKQLDALLDQQRKQLGGNVAFTVIPVGKKIAKIVTKFAETAGVKIEATSLNTRSTAGELRDFTHKLRASFLNKHFDKVYVAYMHFVSSGHQVFQCDQLLPVSYDALASNADRSAANSPCLFEPSANAIFNSVLPLYVSSMMQDVFTESTASEQSARVMAMQAASDNASDLLDDLNLEYNKLRQQSITTELLDIIGGQAGR